MPAQPTQQPCQRPEAGASSTSRCSCPMWAGCPRNNPQIPAPGAAGTTAPPWGPLTQRAAEGLRGTGGVQSPRCAAGRGESCINQPPAKEWAPLWRAKG